MTKFVENNALVSLSHSLKSETVRQEEKKRDMPRDKNETSSLKLFAQAILNRDKVQDRYETAKFQDETKTSKNDGSCLTLKSDLKCRRCFNWQGGISKVGICSLTHERKSHTDFCIEYNDTVGGVYAHNRRE